MQNPRRKKIQSAKFSHFISQWRLAEDITFKPQVNEVSNMIVQHKEGMNPQKCSKNQQLFLLAKEKKEILPDQNEELRQCTFNPEICPKTDEIFENSSFPKDFLRRQYVSAAMNQKKLRMLNDIYKNEFKPQLVAKYEKKLNVG